MTYVFKADFQPTQSKEEIHLRIFAMSENEVVVNLAIKEALDGCPPDLPVIVVSPSLSPYNPSVRVFRNPEPKK